MLHTRIPVFTLPWQPRYAMGALILTACKNIFMY